MDDRTKYEDDFLTLKNQMRRAFIDAVVNLGQNDWKIEDDKAMDDAVLWLIQVRKRSHHQLSQTDIPPLADADRRERRPRSDLAKLSEDISASLAQPVFTPGPR